MARVHKVNLGLLARSWADYERQVLPPDAPPVQRQETRRAFYSGAWAVFCEVARIGGDEVPEDEGCVSLNSIRAECVRFNADVQAGRA